MNLILGTRITGGIPITISGLKIRIRRPVSASGIKAAAPRGQLKHRRREWLVAVHTQPGRIIKSSMNTRRVSIGFDLRVNPASQRENPSQENQHLVPDLRSPISADATVWLTTEGIESLTERILPDFANPLHLKESIDLLVKACDDRGISTTGLWPVCMTSAESNLIALNRRFGPGYFDDQPIEESLLSDGWQFMGFDVVDFDGLISGLKGCGYVEPTWSALRDCFGSSLNKFGLFSDCPAASSFAEVRGLEIRDHAPFVVVGVLARVP